MEGQCGSASAGFQKFDRQHHIGFGNSGLHRSFQLRVQNKDDQKLDIKMQGDINPCF